MLEAAEKKVKVSCKWVVGIRSPCPHLKNIQSWRAQYICGARRQLPRVLQIVRVDKKFVKGAVLKETHLTKKLQIAAEV